MCPFFTSERRASRQFQSSRPKTAEYLKLIENDEPAEKQTFRGKGGRIVAAGGALVKSTGTKISRELPVWLLHAVFGFLGVHQLFTGQVEDDCQRLFQLNKQPNIPPTVLTCKGWYLAAKSMDRIDCKPLRYTLTDAGLTKALKQFPKLTRVCLAECRRVKFLMPVFASFKHVTVLILTGCSNLTDATLSVITMEIPKLTELYIAACTKLSKVAIHKFPGKTSALEVLDLSANQKVTDETVERLMKDHPKLRQLHLTQIESIKEPEIASGCLELLAIDGCEQVKFETVAKILGQCTGLKYLNLSDNDQMLAEKRKAFSMPCHTIVELNFSAIFHDDVAINTALETMPSLRLLECSNSEFVKCPNFAHPTLETLVCNMCYDLQEAALSNLQTKLPNLRHLSCNHCDSLVRPMVIHKTLTLLDLSSCSALLSDSSCAAWLNCPNLKSLYIGHTPHLTDRELVMIIPFASSLRELNLYQATALVEPKLAGLHMLEKINLTNCWSLNQIWLDKLYLPKLRTIYINIEEAYSDENSEGGDPGGW